MTGTNTSRLGLYRPDAADNINVTTDLNDNLDKLDTLTGTTVCTSSTRPNAPYSGHSILETDTGNFLVSNGTSPASGSWKDPVANGLAASNITIGGSGGTLTFPGRLLSQRSSATSTAVEIQVVGDSTARVSVNQSGKIEWGDGSTTRDTNLYRSDIGTLATDGDLAVGGDLSADNFPAGAWVDWTPTWTTSGSTTPSFGNATIVARYTQIGKTVHFRLEITFGSTSNFGTVGNTDNWQFAMPVTAASTMLICGYGEIQDATAGAGSRLGVRPRLMSTSQLVFETAAGAYDPATTLSGSGIIDTATPWAWASSDSIRAFGTYEAA